MSRIGEGDGFNDPEDETAFLIERRAGYVAATPILKEFLVYLDAMPVKRIISNRFVRPATGDMCSVAALCASRGFDWKRLLKTEAESRLQRLENGDWVKGEFVPGGEEADGWDGPTVGSGVQAGVSDVVAFDLAYHNEVLWDRVDTGAVEVCARGTRHHVYRDMTDEERWVRLRALIARKVAQAEGTL